MNTSKQNRSIAIAAILLVFTCADSISSQVSDVSFEKIFLEDGLSQSIVKCILQDRKGYMYFGTEDGLNIYDAYSFKVLRNSPVNPNSLSYNDITSLYEDHNGRLWIGTFNSGVNLYIIDKKKIIRLYYDHNDSNSISNNNINAITEDKEGNLWIATDGGLNCVVGPSSNDSSFIINRGVELNENYSSLNNLKVFTLLTDKQGTLWAGTDNGLYRINKETHNKFYKINEFRNDPNNKTSISNNSIKAIYEDSEGDIWIGTDNGLNRLSLTERKKTNPQFQKFFHSTVNNKTISHNEISAVCEDASGLIWIGTNGGGINIYDKIKDRFVSYQYDPLDKRSLASNEIRALFLDGSGIMWIGTYGGGINKVSRRTGQFFHYRHRPNDENSLSHSIVWSFYQDKDSVLWIGTHNGLNRLDRKRYNFKHYFNIPSKNSLSNNMVRVIIPAGNGKLLLGTNGGGMDEFDPETGNFKNWSNNPDNPNTLIHNEIRSIYKDKDGIIWIGTYGMGLDRFNPRTGLFKHYFNIQNDTNSISHNYVRVIVEDNKGYLWIGTEGGGLNKFDKRKGTFTHYKAGHKNPNSLTSDYIFSILIDSSGFFWIGTYGGGLNKFYPETGECKVYTVNDGLPSNSIYGLLKDWKGNIWLSTTNGLSRFNPLKEKFKNYNVKDGLQDNEFNGGAYYKTESGELLFGGINGFNSFYPGNIEDNSYIPPVVLTSFKKFNQEVEFSMPITSVREIELFYSDVFSFEFAALDYFSPEKNKYAYKMEGVDKDWVFVNADKRFAAYTTLSPGEYTFFVKGSNSDGVWNDKGIQIHIRIVPPFWQRLWFIILIAFMIIGSAYLLYLRRLRIVRMKAELQTAHDAQIYIMPRSDPATDKLEVSGTCIPANEVGGDFFDYFWLDDERKKFGVILGDVSGKAMKAAVTAIMTSGMILSEIRSNRSINKILDNINTTLIKKIEKNMFVSLFVCVIDTETRVMSIANAGLNKPIILSNGKFEFLRTTGPRLPLGVKSNILYEQTNYNLNKGDVIVLTTDGVDEAQNTNRELFGFERLKKYLLSLRGDDLSVSVIKDSIIEEVQKFINKEKPNDDMTVLVIRIK